VRRRDTKLGKEEITKTSRLGEEALKT